VVLGIEWEPHILTVNVTRAKDNVDRLQNETKRLMAELEMARKTLMEAKKRLVETAWDLKFEHGMDTFLNKL